MKFEDALREQIESDPAAGRKGKKILAVLNESPSKRRNRRIARMERTTKEALGLKGAVDWSEQGEIDWGSILMMILELLLKLLPLILASEEHDS